MVLIFCFLEIAPVRGTNVFVRSFLRLHHASKSNFSPIFFQQLCQWYTMGLLQQRSHGTCWRASCPLGHPKQSDFIKINLNFLCFGCRSGQLALQHVPCDRLLQKAHCPCISCRIYYKSIRTEKQGVKLNLIELLRPP